jgi:hypothetical protein
MSYNKWEDIEHKMADDYHVANPDAKMKAKKFWAVMAKKKVEEGGKSKWLKVSGTFDNQDAALRAALRAKEAMLDVEVYECGPVEWREYAPSTKGAKEMWGKVTGE